MSGGVVAGPGTGSIAGLGVQPDTSKTSKVMQKTGLFFIVLIIALIARKFQSYLFFLKLSSP